MRDAAELLGKACINGAQGIIIPDQQGVFRPPDREAKTNALLGAPQLHVGYRGIGYAAKIDSQPLRLHKIARERSADFVRRHFRRRQDVNIGHQLRTLLFEQLRLLVSTGPKLTDQGRGRIGENTHFSQQHHPFLWNEDYLCISIR